MSQTAAEADVRGGRTAEDDMVRHMQEVDAEVRSSRRRPCCSDAVVKVRRCENVSSLGNACGVTENADAQDSDEGEGVRVGDERLTMEQRCEECGFSKAFYRTAQVAPPPRSAERQGDTERKEGEMRTRGCW